MLVHLASLGMYLVSTVFYYIPFTYEYFCPTDIKITIISMQMWTFSMWMNFGSQVLLIIVFWRFGKKHTKGVKMDELNEQQSQTTNPLSNS